MHPDSQETATDSTVSGSKRPRRQRLVIVCTNCRRRKIKCDKAQPCSNCTKNGTTESCTYESIAPSNPGDEYTMELRFDVPGRADPGARNNSPRLGQFSLQDATGQGDSKRSKRNKSSAGSASNELPVSFTSSFNGIEERLKGVESFGTNISDQQKNEIQKLKERLEFIEKSLGRNGPPEKDVMPPELSPASIDPSKSSSGSKSFKTSPMEPYEPRLSAAQMTPHLTSITGQPQFAPNPYLTQPSLYKGAMSYQSPNGLTPSGLTPSAWTPPLMSSAYEKPNSGTEGIVPPFGHHSSILPPLQAFPSENTGFSPTPLESGFKHSGIRTQSAPVETGEMDHSFRNISRQDKMKYLMIGTNIFGKAYDTMSFYENYSSIHYTEDMRRMNFGPFCWSSLMRRDGALKLVWDHVKLKKENSATLVFANDSNEITQVSTNELIKEDGYSKEGESSFKRRALQPDGYEEIIPYKSLLNMRRKKGGASHSPAKPSLPPAVTHYDTQVDHELQVIEKIRAVMPKKRVIWGLIDRFFAEVYVYMPYLDEDYFRADVSRIIGPQSFEEEPVSEVNIVKKLDLAVVGILFTVLRLAYLSLLSNNEILVDKILNSTESTKEIDIIKYLLSSPITIDLIHVAGVCLDQFHFLRRSNFTVLQLALYQKLYHTYAPEDGDGADGGDSQVLTAVVRQMAYQQGIHREPDENCTNLRINNLSRKIWTFISINDIYMSYTFGNPLLFDARFHDTKFPFHVPGGENIRDKQRDQTIIDRFLGCQAIFPQMEALCRLTLDLKNRVALPKLTAMISQLEVDWFESYGTLCNCTQLSGSTTKDIVDRNFKIKTYFSTKAFIMSLFFHIYLHYEDKDSDVAFFYYKKCLLISIADIMPHYLGLLDNSEVVSDMIINPTVEAMVHKSIMVYLSGIIRVNLVIYGMRESKNHSRLCEMDSAYMSHFQKLCQVSSCLTRAAEYNISVINKISGRYYYAWRITKSQTIMLKTVTSSDFYKSYYPKAGFYMTSKYSDSQLQEIIMLCENTLSMFRNSEFSTYGYSDKVESGFNRSPLSVTQVNTAETPMSADDINDVKADKFWFSVLSYKNELSGLDHGEGRTPSKMDGDDQSYGGILDSGSFKVNPMETQIDLFSDVQYLAPLD